MNTTVVTDQCPSFAQSSVLMTEGFHTIQYTTYLNRTSHRQASEDSTCDQRACRSPQTDPSVHTEAITEICFTRHIDTVK